jgi:hypothetical protein
MEAAKNFAKGLKKQYDEGQKQTSGLGAELAARSEMNRQGEKALSGNDSSSATPPAAPAPKTDTGARYGDKPGEKRIDTSSYSSPNIKGSYEHGTPHVPETGIYKLHKGEAVIPKEKNPMNPFAKITSGDKKPRKALKSIHVHATDNGKHIVTHKHHHPEHHPDTTHAMNSADEVGQHVAAAAPSMEPQAPPADEAAQQGAPAMGAPAGM